VEVVQAANGLVGEVEQLVSGELAAVLLPVVDLLLEVGLRELVEGASEVVGRAQLLLDGGRVAD